jgi:hypothetical protein
MSAAWGVTCRKRSKASTPGTKAVSILGFGGFSLGLVEHPLTGTPFTDRAMRVPGKRLILKSATF